MASLKAYAYGLVLLLAVYWTHQGWKTLVAKGRHAAFRRDQRRKAGIPDSDNRPFSIAAAEAAQSRRRQDLTKTQPKAQSQGQAQSNASQNTQASRKAPGSPFRSSSLLPRESSSYSVSNSQAANHSGLHLRRSSPALSPSTAQRAAMLAPGQSSRYDPATYIPSKRFSPSTQDNSLRPLTGSKRPAGRALSDAGSEASTLRPERRSAKHVRGERREYDTRNSDEGSRMAWEATNGSSGHRDEGRGKKRGAEDVRDRGEEDSVFAGRGNGKRGRQYDEGDSMDEDESDFTAGGGSEDEDQNVPPPRGRSAGKRKQDEASVGTGAEAESQDEDEDDVPRRRGAKLAPKSSKASKLAAKKAPSERTLRDEMMMLDEDDVDAEDSLRSQKARAAGSTLKVGGTGSVKDMPDKERQIGEEWVDPVNGLQWRMDEDEVLTEEEGSATGRKRRVTVKRRVKRRLTVKREMRKKWDMPSDSTHPDREELVPHYVPAWLSEAEFEDAKRRGELGFQVGEAMPSSPGQTSAGSRASPVRSPRNVDSLFHQAPNPRPLFGSRLSSPARSSPAPLLRASASSSSLSGSVSKKPGGRISLAGASSASTDSPLRSRVLDTAGKRRREEELLRKLRESNQVQASPRSAPSSSAGPTSGFGQPAEDKAQPSVSFALPPGGSEEGKKETQSTTSAQGRSSPFSFGPPPSKPTESKPSPVPFSFGGPKTDAPTSAPATSGSGNGGAAPFSFGAPSTQASAPPSSSAVASKSSPAPFSFGAPPTSNSATTAQAASTPFSFGAPKKDEGGSSTAAKPSSGFSFGSSSSGGGASAPSSAPAPSVPSFSFGAPSSNTSSAPKPSTPFSFGAASSGAPAAAGGNAQPAKPAFTFGGGAGGSGAAGQNGAAGGASTGGGFTFSFGKK